MGRMMHVRARGAGKRVEDDEKYCLLGSIVLDVIHGLARARPSRYSCVNLCCLSHGNLQSSLADIHVSKS